jgi:hypothetical protein
MNMSQETKEDILLRLMARYVPRERRCSADNKSITGPIFSKPKTLRLTAGRTGRKNKGRREADRHYSFIGWHP